MRNSLLYMVSVKLISSMITIAKEYALYGYQIRASAITSMMISKSTLLDQAMPWFHAFESRVSVVIDTKYCLRGLRLTYFMLVSGEVEQLFILIDESESRKKSVFLSTYGMLS
ncbi:unnamed protein product, partial [Owenia fusiformis]